MGNERTLSKWIHSHGGPLILMEVNKLKGWKGIGEEFPSPEGVVSDYDRACRVDDYLGLVKVGDYDALVLGAEPMGTAWLINVASTGIIVRWEYGETDEEVEGLIKNMSLDHQWEKSGVTFDIFAKEIVIFDSATDFMFLEDRLDIEIEPGKYEMENLFYKPDKSTSLLLHRFQPIGKAEVS